MIDPGERGGARAATAGGATGFTRQVSSFLVAFCLGALRPLRHAHLTAPRLSAVFPLLLAVLCLAMAFKAAQRTLAGAAGSSPVAIAERGESPAPRDAGERAAAERPARKLHARAGDALPQDRPERPTEKPSQEPAGGTAADERGSLAPTESELAGARASPPRWMGAGSIRWRPGRGAPAEAIAGSLSPGLRRWRPGGQRCPLDAWVESVPSARAGLSIPLGARAPPASSLS